MTATEMWSKFGNKGKYTAWYFGNKEDADILGELVKRGKKTATSSLFALYNREEELPKEGDFSVILNSQEEAICIIQTTKVYLKPFRDVTEEHALKEGEGDCSLSHWRKVHKAFFTNELKESQREFSEDMLIVCEEFKRVF